MVMWPIFLKLLFLIPSVYLLFLHSYYLSILQIRDTELGEDDREKGAEDEEETEEDLGKIIPPSLLSYICLSDTTIQ